MLVKQRIQSVQPSSVDVNFICKENPDHRSGFFYADFLYESKCRLRGSLLTNRRFYCYNLYQMRDDSYLGRW